MPFSPHHLKIDQDNSPQGIGTVRKKLAETSLTLRRPNRPKPARLSILLCLTPDDFTRQWGTPGSQWVKSII